MNAAPRRGVAKNSFMSGKPMIFQMLMWLCLLPAAFSASAVSAEDARTIFRSFNSAFYVQRGTNGFFRDTQTGGVACFWEQAEEIECIIDAQEWNADSAGPDRIAHLLNGFIKHNGALWTNNIYNDDIMWATIAFARGGRVTGNTNYFRIAKNNFDACFARAWDARLGGGLYWATDNGSKNACVNGPGAIAASLLFQIYGDTNYWNRATNLYFWERSVLFNPRSGAVSDRISTNGEVSEWASTYNQGTFIGAANFLGQTDDALLAADFTRTRLTRDGILEEYGSAGNNSGFNAIFLRWLARFMNDRHLQGRYESWLQANAAAAWNVRRPEDNLSWCRWRHSSPPGTNFCSWDCIASLEALQAARPAGGAAAK